MTEIAQSIIAAAPAADLFARADELFATLMEQGPGDDGLSLSIRKTSSGPLGLGTTFRATVRAGGLPLGVELRCTEYTPPQRVTVQSTNVLPLAVTLDFQPHGGNGTQVTARLRYEPPPGMAGALFQMFAPPARIEETIRSGLERLRQQLATARG